MRRVYLTISPHRPRPGEHAGAYLRYYRRVFRFTQAAAALQLGIHLRTLQFYEADRRIPDQKLLRRVAHALRYA